MLETYPQYGREYTEFHEAGFIEDLPMMTGIQAEGAAPIANAVRKGKNSIEPVANPETVPPP